MNGADRQVIRDLARQYLDIAGLPIQQERRQLWAAHFSLKPVRPPIQASIGMWNKWCMDYFGPHTLVCKSEVLRQYELLFRLAFFQHDIGDDTILEPWVTVQADRGDGWDGLWGLQGRTIAPETKEGAWKFDPAIRALADAERMQVPHHYVNEETTRLRRWVELARDEVAKAGY